MEVERGDGAAAPQIGKSPIVAKAGEAALLRGGDRGYQRLGLRLPPQREIGARGGAGDRVGGIGARVEERASAISRIMRLEDLGTAQRHGERQRTTSETFRIAGDIGR